MYTRPACVLLVLFTSSCFQARYLTQAARGQAELLAGARSIDSVVTDRAVDPRVRALLGQVATIKAFGKRHGLRPTGNYESYVQLRRPSVSWVVSACEPLGFEAKHWSFPIVGSVPYLGFFDPLDAAAYARSLEADGLDVDVRPVEAYSTLGWFKDPVLSSMIPPGETTLADLANVILHESTHASVYVPDQGFFNESLASFVADVLTPLFLKEREGPGSRSLAAWEARAVRGGVRVEQLHRTYAALERLYQSPLPDTQKRAEKKRILAAARAQLGWRRKLNNATLMQFKTYAAASSGFRAVYDSCAQDMPAFLRKMAALSGAVFGSAQRDELDTLLMLLVHQGC